MTIGSLVRIRNLKKDYRRGPEVVRVLDGLEGAAAEQDSGFDRGEMETLLSGLGSRVFLMNNVHEDEPVLFHTRWALSYLPGPLTRQQIKRLTAARKAAPAPVAPCLDSPGIFADAGRRGQAV